MSINVTGVLLKCKQNYILNSDIANAGLTFKIGISWCPICHLI